MKLIIFFSLFLTISVALMAQSTLTDVPLVINWELYCNEPVDDSLKSDWSRPRTEEELRGFWLVKPDGSMGITGTFWDKLLKNPGGKFPK